MWSRLSHPLLALTLLAAVALSATWPLATSLATHYPTEGSRSAAPDQLLTSWILAAATRQLVSDPLHPFESNNFHPFRRTLTYSGDLLGLAVLVLPVQYASDNPVLTQNVAFLLALTLGGWGVFLLVREVSGSAVAGFVAGVLALCAPSHWWNLTQLHMIAEHWTPLALFTLARVLRTGQWRWGIALGIATAFQAWSSPYCAVFLALALSVGVPVLLIFSPRARSVLPQLVGAGLIAAVLVIPLALSYRATAREMDIATRGAALFLWPPDIFTSQLGRPLSYLQSRLASGERSTAFGTLMPWILIGAGAVVAVLARRRPAMDFTLLVALAVGGFANWLLALGPVRWHGLPSLHTFITTSVPGLGFVRGPVRAISYTHLILCVLGGCGLGAVLRRLPSPAARAGVLVPIAALMVVEIGWKPLSLTPAPLRPGELAAAVEELPPGCAIAELPYTFESSAEALYRSTGHWRPVVTGYGGLYPVDWPVMQALLHEFPAQIALDYLWAAGACAVVVGGRDRVRQIMANPRVRGLEARAVGSRTMFRLPSPPPPAPPEGNLLPRDGWRVVRPTPGDGSLALDGDLETLWEGEVKKREPDRLTIDLGEPTKISAVEVELGYHFRRHLVSYLLEGSLDGKSGWTLAEAPLAIPPLASYRANPTQIRQRIDLQKPVEIRFLRIGPYRRPPPGFQLDGGFVTWGVAELRAYGVPATGSPD
jgi:hypothetical protein